jgi:hypothetical protein
MDCQSSNECISAQQGKVSIQDARDVFNWATKNEKAISYMFYSDEEYNSAANYLANTISKAVPGTMSLHAVPTDGDGKMYVRQTSCYGPFTCTTYPIARALAMSHFEIIPVSKNSI